MAKTIDVRLSNISLRAEGKAYTIGTLSRYADQYEAMVETFVANGFGVDDCEFLVVDNRRDDQWDAFHGLNEVLNQAQGRYVILCHEDVRLMQDGRAELDASRRRAFAARPFTPVSFEPPPSGRDRWHRWKRPKVLLGEVTPTC
ncbi:hypothetical protein NKH53_27670 [Mesorhizobium australicum]|uniref:hypothetical protein n=1 Tax=Mesorhizobium australicum TaxID=536018 RepID=UPI003335F4F2